MDGLEIWLSNFQPIAIEQNIKLDLALYIDLTSIF
jgi:hypothetical protein